MSVTAPTAHGRATGGIAKANAAVDRAARGNDIAPTAWRGATRMAPAGRGGLTICANTAADDGAGGGTAAGSSADKDNNTSGGTNGSELASVDAGTGADAGAV